MDTFHKSIQYALEKLGKSKSGFERTVVSKFKRKTRVGSGNELVDYSRAPSLGADQKVRGLWERDWNGVSLDKNRMRMRAEVSKKIQYGDVLQAVANYRFPTIVDAVKLDEQLLMTLDIPHNDSQ